MMVLPDSFVRGFKSSRISRFDTTHADDMVYTDERMTANAALCVASCDKN